MEKEIALVYMAAGMSSRFGGKIKALVPVLGEKTLIDVSLEQALKSGFDKIVFIVSKNTEKAFKDKFGNEYNGLPVYYALQEYDESKRDKPWGTSDAVCSAKEFIDSGFVVCNTDDLYGEETFRILFNSARVGENAAIGYKIKNTLREAMIGNRAMFITNNDLIESINETFGLSLENLKERGIEENTLCSMNIWVLNKETLGFLDARLGDFKKINENDRKIEAILPVELNKLLLEKKIKMRLYPSEDKPIGITNPGDEELVRRALTSLD